MIIIILIFVRMMITLLLLILSLLLLLYCVLYAIQGRGRIEKTEIIEMTIKHLKHLMATNQQHQHQSQSSTIHQLQTQNCKNNDNITNGSADCVSDETNSRSQNASIKHLGYSIDKCCVRCSSSESGSSSGSESCGFINNPSHSDNNNMASLDNNHQNINHNNNYTNLGHNSNSNSNTIGHDNNNNNTNSNNMSLLLLSEEEKKKYFEFGFHQCLLRLSQYMINELDWPLFNNNYKNCNDQKQIALFTDHLVSQLNNYAQNLKVLAHRTTSIATTNLSSSDQQQSPSVFGFDSTRTATTTTSTPPPSQPPQPSLQPPLISPVSSVHLQKLSQAQLLLTPSPQPPTPPQPSSLKEQHQQHQYQHQQQQQRLQSTNHQVPIGQSLHQLVILTPESPAQSIPMSTSPTASVVGHQTDNNQLKQLDFKCSFRSFKKGMTDRFQRGAQFS